MSINKPPLIPDGPVFPFARSRDALTGAEQIHCQVNPPSNRPSQTGTVLAALWGLHDYALVEVTELGYEYVEDGEMADPDEWQWWVDLSTFSNHAKNEN
jgi:hypothetical protein